MTSDSFSKRIAQEGFTLAELLITIAIIGLLASIILATTAGSREQAQIAKTLQWSRSVQSLLGADAVGIWNLDEDSAIHGTVIADLSGWGNNGTLSTGDGAVSKSVPGVVNNALSFDGVNDYVSLGNPPSLQIADTVTIEGWVYLKSQPGTIQAWFGNGYTQAGSIFIGAHSAVGGSWWVMLGPTREFAFGTKVFNQWVHLTVTLDLNLGSNQLKGYQDGVLRNQITWANDIMTRSSTRLIGYGSAGNYWDGFVDEVRIYGTALTAAQIGSRYYAGLERLLVEGQINQDEYQQRLARI